MDFSKKLKKLRIEKGFTQKQIADALNVSQNAVYNWENDKREPSLITVKKIADLLDVPPSYLMGWQDEDSQIDLQIDSEIDNLIEHLENKDLGKVDIPKIVQKIRYLTEKQKNIESKIRDIDFNNANSIILSEYFDSNEYSKSELKEIRDFAEFIKGRRMAKPDEPPEE